MPRSFNPSGMKPRKFWEPKGKKEVFLPSFTITLLRTSYLPPNMACFQVPLNLNKLDMKDYLYNAYGIPVLSVRSYIQQSRIRQGKESDIVDRPRYMTRPKSTKRMIVELAEGEHGGPFVWPDAPEDFESWDNKSYEALKTQQNEGQITQRWEDKLKRGHTVKKAQTVSEAAKALLSGEKAWTPTLPTHGR